MQPSPGRSQSISHHASERLVYGSHSGLAELLEHRVPPYLFSVCRERLRECEKVEGRREEGRRHKEERKAGKKEGDDPQGAEGASDGCHGGPRWTSPVAGPGQEAERAPGLDDGGAIPT